MPGVFWQTPAMTGWRPPKRTGAVLYAVGAAVVGVAVALISRLELHRQRGRRRLVERLPSGPLIVISNHTSYADGLMLALIGRRMGRSLRMLATAGVFRAPLIGRVLRALGFIPVERGTERAAHSLDAALEALRAGEAVAMFPEGRISRDPQHWPERAKTGAVRLALASGAPVVPVAMVGAHEVVGRRRLVRRIVANLFRRPRVRTAVGAPIDVRALAGTATPDAARVRALADEVMARLIDLIEALRGEVAPAPSGVVVDAGIAGDAEVRPTWPR